MASDVLTPLQQSVLTELFGDPWLHDHFYLTGGTALAAYYLRHRRSDDLDLFTHDDVLNGIDGLLRSYLVRTGWRVEQTGKAPRFLRYRLNDELQLDFVVDVPFRVGSPQRIDAVMVDSLKNIAVNKVCAILGRLDPKDYVDLFFILRDQELDILELLDLAGHKDAGMDRFIWASLVGTAELGILPSMIRPVSLAELAQFYRALRDQILDAIRPK